MDTILSPALTVDRLFAKWPQTTAVFLRRRFACIGCLMAPFDTLEDVARNYQVDLGDLLLELSMTSEGKNYHGGTEK
ncbi:MAG: hypothetical protein ACYDHA_06075 [Bellilinea sp.]